VTLYDLNNGTIYTIISEINFCQKTGNHSGLKLCTPGFLLIDLYVYIIH